MWKPNFKFGYVFAIVYLASIAAALVLYPQAWAWWISAYALHVLIFTLGVSYGLHRAISHRRADSGARHVQLAALVGTLANVGSPIDFMLTHRTHHRYADGPQDPQNSAVLGWKLLVGMRSPATASDPLLDLYESREELRQPFLLWIHHNYYLILIAYALLAYVAAGNKGLLFLALIPSGLSFFALGALNYFGHRAQNGARDILWLFPLILTECWHGDHHAR